MQSLLKTFKWEHSFCFRYCLNIWLHVLLESFALSYYSGCRTAEDIIRFKRLTQFISANSAAVMSVHQKQQKQHKTTQNNIILQRHKHTLTVSWITNLGSASPAPARQYKPFILQHLYFTQRGGNNNIKS